MAASIDQTLERAKQPFQSVAERVGKPAPDEEVMEDPLQAVREMMDVETLRKEMMHLYTETFTREELQVRIDFVSTPAGQGFLEKKGEFRQRAVELTNARMMDGIGKMPFLVEEVKEADAAENSQAPEPTPRAGGRLTVLPEAGIIPHL